MRLVWVVALAWIAVLVVAGYAFLILSGHPA